MFTDIAGYTALMGKDEDRAFEVLRINKEIHTQLIEKYHRTIIKELGVWCLITSLYPHLSGQSSGGP